MLRRPILTDGETPMGVRLLTLLRVISTRIPASPLWEGGSCRPTKTGGIRFRYGLT